MKYILAIDQGTTGSRAIVYNKKGQVVASAYQEFPQYFPQPGWVEHNAEEIWESVYASIQKILAKIPGSAIAAIGITNQRETTVIWDIATGRPIHNAIVWQCRRTAKRCEQLKKKYSKVWPHKTGLPIDAYFSGTKIEWILKNVPGAYIKALKGQLRFGTIDSWLLWNLTGGAVHATDYTNASRTMLFNIKTLDWDKQILKTLDIPHSLLPTVQRSSGLFGKTIKIGKLSAGIPITGIAGDQQAALFGQACFEPGTIKNTYGTGCFMLLNTGKQRPLSKHGLITTIACAGDGSPCYALEGSVFVAGAAIQWLRDHLRILPEAAASEKLATTIETNDGVYFVPALVGIGAPYWNPEARGLITGITRGTTRNHIIRAALESMCYQTKDVLEAMKKDSGLTIKELRVDGGAVANNFLCQFQADILGVAVIRPSIIETTSLGAAYLAGLGISFWRNTTEIKENLSIDKQFIYQMPRTQAALYYSNWKKAVARTLL